MIEYVFSLLFKSNMQRKYCFFLQLFFYRENELENTISTAFIDCCHTEENFGSCIICKCQKSFFLRHFLYVCIRTSRSNTCTNFVSNRKNLINTYSSCISSISALFTSCSVLHESLCSTISFEEFFVTW